MGSEGLEQLRRWKELASEAANETDPEKLVRIVKDLCSLLDAERKPPASVPGTTDHAEETERTVAKPKIARTSK